MNLNFRFGEIEQRRITFNGLRISRGACYRPAADSARRGSNFRGWSSEFPLISFHVLEFFDWFKRCIPKLKSCNKRTSDFP
jgi:hypothetical protein